MRWLRQSRGFTLVELVIVLGITALAISAVLVGNGALRQDAAFKGAIDGVKNQLRQVQNEASHAISTNQSSATGQTSTVIFGKLVTYTPGSPDNKVMKTWTLVGTKQGNEVTGLAKCNEIDTTMDDGVIYTGAQQRSVVFTRQPESLFVAPTTATEIPTASGVCDSTTSDPADQLNATGVPPSPCTGTSTFERPDGNATGFCRNAAPPQPTVKAYDSTKEVTNSTTSEASVTIKVYTSGDTVDVYRDGTCVYCGQKPAAGNDANGRFLPYTYNFSDNLSHSFYAKTYNGNSTASPQSATITVQRLDLTNCANYVNHVCGLKGEYFRGTHWDQSSSQGGTGQSARAVAKDTQIGDTLGNAESSYGNFIPTLSRRTGQIAGTVAHASVRWTGEIYVDSTIPNVCIDSPSDVSTITVNGLGSGSGTRVCLTVGSNTGWKTISITYAHNSSNGEGNAAVRLVNASNALYPGSRLASTSFSTYSSGVPAQGFKMQYYDGLLYTYSEGGPRSAATYKSLEYLNGVGSSSSPATYPNWNSYLRGKIGDTDGTHDMTAMGFSYIFMPRTARVVVCTDADDGSNLLWGGFNADDPGSSIPRATGNSDRAWVINDNPNSGAGHSTAQRCSSSFNASQGQHFVQLTNEDSCHCGTGNTTTIRVTWAIQNPDGSWPGQTEVPMNYWSNIDYGQTFYAEAAPPTFRLQEITDNLYKNKSTQEEGVQSKLAALKRQLSNLLIPQNALAAGSCNTNILNPYNYTNECAGFTDTVELPFQVEGDTAHTAKLKFNHSSKTIDRSIE